MKIIIKNMYLPFIRSGYSFIMMQIAVQKLKIQYIKFEIDICEFISFSSVLSSDFNFNFKLGKSTLPPKNRGVAAKPTHKTKWKYTVVKLFRLRPFDTLPCIPFECNTVSKIQRQYFGTQTYLFIYAWHSHSKFTHFW